MIVYFHVINATEDYTHLILLLLQFIIYQSCVGVARRTCTSIHRWW